MYNNFFGFRERPFQLVPNPEYLFLGKSHEEALAHLTYAVTSGDGFVEITGEVGTGKTTLCRVFLDNLEQNVEVAYIFNPMKDAVQMLKSINDEFSVDSTPDNAKDLIDNLNRFLIEKKGEDKKVILVIDEAQNLGKEVLEQLRLLSNLETNTSKLIQIIMVGQPELGEMLDSRELRQLAQRITLSCHLSPLSFKETRNYILHRIKVASLRESVKFTRGAFTEIFRYSGGVPRLVNISCDRALLTAYGLNKHTITTAIARSAIRELAARGDMSRFKPLLQSPRFWAIAGVCVIFVLGIFFYPGFQSLITAARSPDLKTQNNPIISSSPEKSRNTVENQASAKRNSSPPKTEKPTPPSLEEPAGSKTGKTLAAASKPPENSPATSPEPGDTLENKPAAKEKNPLPKIEPDPAREKEPPAETLVSSAPEKTNPPETKSQKEKQPRLVQDWKELLQEEDIRNSGKIALRNVFEIWENEKTDIPDSLLTLNDPSKFFQMAARYNGFTIQKIQNDFELIKTLNLPAVFEFHSGNENISGYLALAGIENDRLLFLGKTKDTLAKVSLEEMNKYWTGSAYIPWKDFYGFDGTIPRNASRDSILALKLLLKEVGFDDLDMNPSYDRKTRNAIKALQRKNGLKIDGVVGPNTKIMLYNELDSLKIPHIVVSS